MSSDKGLGCTGTLGAPTLALTLGIAKREGGTGSVRVKVKVRVRGVNTYLGTSLCVPSGMRFCVLSGVRVACMDGMLHLEMLLPHARFLYGYGIASMWLRSRCNMKCFPSCPHPQAFNPSPNPNTTRFDGTMAVLDGKLLIYGGPAPHPHCTSSVSDDVMLSLSKRLCSKACLI